MKTMPKPMFISTPEGEEKLCTRCQDYWPCDTEFFAKVANAEGGTSWGSWCRACASEATKISRERSHDRARIRRVGYAVAAMVLLTTRVHASEYCDRLSTVAFELQQGKEAGMTRTAAKALSVFTTDAVFHEAGAPLIDMIYDGNDDNTYSPGAVADLVRSVCESTETNALTQKAKP